MKILCFIAAVYVALLTAIPCCQDDDCTETVASNTSAQHQKDKDCKGCSPFFTCGSCTAFTFPIQLFYFKKPVVKTARPLVIYRWSYANPYSGFIWQPPKMS